jgi:hypothetical protein
MIKGRLGMAPGSIVDLTFFVAGRGVSVTAMVIYEAEYCGDNLTGLRFISMAPRDLAALEEFIGRKIRFADDEEEALPRGGAHSA